LKRFSERMGLKKVKTDIQVDSIDEALRNCLWNVLTVYYWESEKPERPYVTEPSPHMKVFLKKLWQNYFKESFDSIPDYWNNIHEKLQLYYFNCEWYEVYDVLEFTAHFYPRETVNKEFMDACNSVLESELSAYRFVGGKITQITSEEEISEIEEALETPLEPVRVHLGKALKLMSDKKSPDYRNSLKESIVL